MPEPAVPPPVPPSPCPTLTPPTFQSLNGYNLTEHIPGSPLSETIIAFPAWHCYIFTIFTPPQITPIYAKPLQTKSLYAPHYFSFTFRLLSLYVAAAEYYITLHYIYNIAARRPRITHTFLPSPCISKLYRYRLSPSTGNSFLTHHSFWLT